MAGTNRGVVYRQVLAALGASAGAYAAALSLDEAYEDQAVMDAILNQEAFLLHKLAESWFNGNRTNETGLTDIIKTLSVADGALLPRHIGPVIGVEIDGLLGEYCAAAEVRRLRARNPLNLKLTGNLYGLEDNRFFFTAEDTTVTAADVHLFQWVKPTLADLAAFKASNSPVPNEYEQCWIDLSVAAVMPREGAMTGAAAFHQARANAVLGEIASENRVQAVSRQAQMSGE